MNLFLLLVVLTAPLLANDLSIVEELKSHEGYSKYIRNDRGNPSIGYGINLTYGISKAEAELLLIHRVEIITTKLTTYSWYNHLSPNRKEVIVNMAYNLGINGMLEFKGMIWALTNSYWHGAANAMKDSMWYSQTGNRAKRLYMKMWDG